MNDRPYAMRRIWSGQWLGALAGLGLIGAIFFLTVCRIVLAIILDAVHSYRTKTKGTDNA